jgi:hypothetical protein
MESDFPFRKGRLHNVIPIAELANVLRCAHMGLFVVYDPSGFVHFYHITEYRKDLLQGAWFRYEAAHVIDLPEYVIVERTIG